MEEEMDVVHESNTEENNSISLKELSQSIEEVTETPDIFIFFEVPFDQGTHNDKYNSKINNNVYNEIMNNKVVYMSRTNSLMSHASSLNLDKSSDIGITQTSEIDSKSISDDDYTNYFNIKLKINDNNKKKKRVHFNGLTSIGQPLQIKENIDRYRHNFSDLMQMYCYKCKIATMNYIDRKCYICEKSLLFQCKNCSGIYKRLVIIQNHIRYECYLARIFECAECDYKSSTKFHLRKHIKDEHMIETVKDFECLKCNKKYKIKSNLLAHEKICSQGMTMQCKYCTFKSKFNNRLIIHIESKHPEVSTENQNKCLDCGKRLKDGQSLKRHIKNLCGKKMKFKCDHCDYRINKKYCLAKHMHQQHPQLFIKTKFL